MRLQELTRCIKNYEKHPFHCTYYTLAEHTKISFIFSIQIQKMANFSEAVVQRYPVKKVFFKISQNLRKTPVPDSLFKKSSRSEACNCIKKETLAQVFSCKSWEIFKNTFFYITPLEVAFGFSEGLSF